MFSDTAPTQDKLAQLLVFIFHICHLFFCLHIHFTPSLSENPHPSWHLESYGPKTSRSCNPFILSHQTKTTQIILDNTGLVERPGLRRERKHNLDSQGVNISLPVSPCLSLSLAASLSSRWCPGVAGQGWQTKAYVCKL